MKKSLYYAVLFTSDEISSDTTGDLNVIVHKGARFWTCVDDNGAPTMSLIGFLDYSTIPENVKTFPTVQDAMTFAKEWKGHPWWVKPIDFEIVAINPKIIIQQYGYTRAKHALSSILSEPLTKEQAALVRYQRVAFEAWYGPAHPKAVDPFKRDHRGRYCKIQIEAAWQGWLACTFQNMDFAT